MRAVRSQRWTYSLPWPCPVSHNPLGLVHHAGIESAYTENCTEDDDEDGHKQRPAAEAASRGHQQLADGGQEAQVVAAVKRGGVFVVLQPQAPY